ncbi:MAG: hypothetical protein H6Q42_4184 [Deltaproteobacteria bacterium]|jgi:hypothetical protein|nr:hypothetical protein [Deltaproteobacteria bacterium]
MDIAKVDRIIQYALAVAAGEDFCNRELGPIHLIKYVYLADLAHSEKNKGKTFTGTPWKFHHFGPWDLGVHNRIEPACSHIGAEKKSIPSEHKEGDFFRWSVKNEGIETLLERDLPIDVTSTIKWAIRKFGSDTASLLNHVYLTGPMLKGAPEEFLDFSSPDQPELPEPPMRQEMSKREQKRKSQEIKEAKNKIQQKLAERNKSSQRISVRPPRYDEVFFAGCEWLDSLAGGKIEELSGEAVFSSEIWKSRTRFDPEIS